MARRAQRRAPPQLKETTVRDFSGGLNVIDNELNLDPRFSVVMDNISRAPDGSVAPRYGLSEFLDWEDGTETPFSATIAIGVTNGSTLVTVTHNAHGYATGDHIQFTAGSLSAVGGIPAAELERKHSIIVTGVNAYTFHVRTAATSTTNPSATRTGTRDTHKLSGNIINMTYFQNYQIVFTDTGEVGMADAAGTKTRIWNWSVSSALSGSPAPWRWCTYVTFVTNKAKLIAFNSYDKPLEIDPSATIKATYLVDPATSSNAAIPVGRIGTTVGGYLAVVELAARHIIRMSAKNAPGVFTGNIAPDDAVDIDLTQVTSAINPQVMALNVYRDKLYAAFQDNALLGTVGIYAGTAHEPEFGDTLSQHGTVSHRTTIPLGNDLFALDYTGVPSVTTSLQSGQFVPDRISDLIEPMIQKHLGRLTDLTLEEKTFAVWNKRQRQYMLFIPKYEDDYVLDAPDDPLFITTNMLNQQWCMLNLPNHTIEEGDQVIISGVTGTVGGVAASDINGTRRVRAVVDEDFILIDVAGTFTSAGVQAGGSSVTVQPVNDETIGYVYTYYPKLKVKTWHRFRGWNFACGSVSLKGSTFFAKGLKVYRYGSDADPIYDDLGEPINWAWELPWADFDRRWGSKTLKHLMPDAKGTAKFTIELFVDNLYRSRATQDRVPARTMTFVGADSGGYGVGPQPFGGGRKTRDQLLWAVPLKHKLLKVRFSGQTTEPLRLVGVSFTYLMGNIHR